MANGQEQVWDNMSPADQEQISTPKPDHRGRVTNSAPIRYLRSREQWERSDTLWIGQGAADQSKGWFNTFAAAANVSQWSWFQGRDANVDLAYTNQKSERYDYAQDLYTCEMEFLAPTYQAELVDGSAASQKAAQLIWLQEIPKALGVEVLLADADIIAQAAATSFMAGKGNFNAWATDSAGAMVNGGNNGAPNKGNAWQWPEPIMIAAVAKLTVRAYVATPLKSVLLNLPGPFNDLIPNGTGGFIEKPNWFGIRVTFRGPRYMQLRSARSAA